MPGNHGISISSYRATDCSARTTGPAGARLKQAESSERGGSIGPRQIRVCLFCGGRGSATIIRALMAIPSVHLSLIINGYDDGRSTGVLRRLLPGMLGPSDFRKNLSHLLEDGSPDQTALKAILDYRLTGPSCDRNREDLWRLATGRGLSDRASTVARLFSKLEQPLRESLTSYLAVLLEHEAVTGQAIAYQDLSLGNLIFAGAYLKIGSFNTVVRYLSRLGQVRADLLNVCRGESRWLAALKEDGELLASEAEIVGEQSSVPIAELFLMMHPIEAEERRTLSSCSRAQKQARLQAREGPVHISEEAARSIINCDVILYGPGTQHSSLLPSYRIAATAIRQSRAMTKIMILNLRRDHDIQDFSPMGLVDRVLSFMAQPEVPTMAITHLLCDSGEDPGTSAASQLDQAFTMNGTQYRGIRIVPAGLRHTINPASHCGQRVVRHVLAVHEKTAGMTLR